MTRHRKRTAPTKYIDILFRCFSSVRYVTPLLLLGANGPTCQLQPFFMMNSKKSPALVCPIDAIGASARLMVAFSGFYESHKPLPSGDACGIVPPHREGHQNGQQSGYILHLRFVCCRPGGRRGDTERVVARWRHLLAFMKALVVIYRAMPHVPHQRPRMAIEMACDGGAFVRRRRLYFLA